jgi:hypothetical protein
MNYTITYNFENTDQRADFIAAFENVLQNLGLQKESTNQSTYYGPYPYPPQSLATEMHNALNRLDWIEADEVTIYYPKATEVNRQRKADIGRHYFKSEGNMLLNHNVIGQ